MRGDLTDDDDHPKSLNSRFWTRCFDNNLVKMRVKQFNFWTAG